MKRNKGLFIFLFWMLAISGKAQVFPDSLSNDIFEKKKTDYYSDHAIPFNISSPKNIHYRVQVGSFTQAPDPTFFKDYYPVTGIDHQKIKRYYIGLFTRYANAELAREILVEAGFKGAFLVAFHGEEEMSLSKAIDTETSFVITSPQVHEKKESDIRLVITPLPPRKENTALQIDSTKLFDNNYYLDYFYYYFENASPLTGINTKAEEIMPIVWPGDTMMSFVRAFSEENLGGMESGHDVWLAKSDSNSFSTYQAFQQVNTIYNNAIVGISSDAKRVYLLNHYEKKGVKRGLSIISFSGGIWSEPAIVPIPELPFSGDFYGMYVHPDEDVILLSMQGKESYGMNDIYVIEKDPSGNWGALQHLDSTINTDGNDISPFLSEDKKLFLYSTDGMGGMGGNDILIFKRLDSSWTSWSEAQNAGIEVNTAQFDAYPFIVNRSLYFSSVRDSGLANIYHADIVSSMFTPLEEYLEPIDSLLFTFNVEAGTISNENEEELEFESIPVLSMVNTDARIDMIFFDYDRYNLKPSFTSFLNELEKVLSENPDIGLDLRGYTDSIGTLAYNYVLGENRAESVKDYLISIGVGPNRIKASSFGKEFPIASNETAYGRAKNRRVEIRFIRKEED